MPHIPSGIYGIFLFGFFGGCFLLHYWLAYFNIGPFKALAMKYVVTPFSVTLVVDKVSSKHSLMGLPGSIKVGFNFVLTSF